MWSKYLRWFFALALIAGFLTPGAARTQAAETGGYKPGELLVKFGPSAPAKTFEQFRQAAGARYDRTIAGSEIEIWQVPVGSELATSLWLSGQPEVLLAEPNYEFHALDTIPNDPSYYRQWAYQNIHSETAWDYTTGSSSVTIAILDTGIDETHPDLASKIVAGHDFYYKDGNPHDLNGHGTHVAGIAAAASDNNIGVAGMSWGARLMPVQVLNELGVGYTSDLIDGILWASQNGARIINFSLGGYSYSQPLQEAVNSAHNAGLLFVAAMGNEGSSNTYYPAAMNNVLAVAATGFYDERASYSNYGNHCDLAAPGGGFLDPGIYSTMPTYDVDLTLSEGYSKNYDYLEGTSMATPFVAGLAALIWSRDPSLRADEVQQIMQDTAEDLGPSGWDPYFGWGRIDAAAAILATVPLVPPDLHPIANADVDGNYRVEWGSVSNAVQYSLQEDEDASFASPKLVYQGAATQIDISGQPAGYYYYRVRAENVEILSEWSQTRAAGVAPATPALQLTPDGADLDAYRLSWSQVTGAETYILQESQAAGFASPVTRYLGTSLSYAVTGQEGGDWYYRVAASNQAGASAWSTSEISVTVPAPALEPPVLAPISNPDNEDTFALNWSAVPTVTAYSLEASQDMYFSQPAPVYTGALTSFQMKTDTGGNWYFRVRAIALDGRSAWSLPRSTQVFYRIRLPVILKLIP